MSTLYNTFTEQLATLPNVTLKLWKETTLLCVLFNGKEIAHFHGEAEIDIRLSRAEIKRRGLYPPAQSTSHPDRSKNSRWLVQALDGTQSVDALVALVQTAATIRAKNG